MIEVSNIRVDASRLDGVEQHELAVVRRAVSRMIGVDAGSFATFELRRRSIDARKRNNLLILFTARLTLDAGPQAEKDLLARLAKRHKDKNVRLVEDVTPALPARRTSPLEDRPVVVGAGCAGLFCALALAEAGLEPLLVERGDDAARRGEAIRTFDATGALDPQSNIQFGLGGAGTFSDGKLQTGTKSPLHRLVLQTFVDAGAAQSILWDAKPHVGSDVLPTVVTNICRRIEVAGGEVACRTRMVNLAVTDGRVCGVTLERTDADGTTHEEHLATSHVLLACGHSARDVFELLQRRGVTLERKTFAMGVRIEHLQADINRTLYGMADPGPALGAAPYKLVAHLPSGRSAFSFCMCPGGYVVAAASEPGGVVTNGMSLAARAGTNANAGLLANVRPEDLPGSDVLAGVKLQRTCEQAAFAAGGGDFVAPAQLVGDFLSRTASSAPGRIVPTYPRGVAWGIIDECLPPYVVETLREAIPLLDRKLHGFATPDAVLTGVESRSSSPVRVTRGDDGQSVSCTGLWPVGEGAGYAGGIMSAATDGLRAANNLLALLS